MLIATLTLAATVASAQCVNWEPSPALTPYYSTTVGPTASQWDCNTKCQNKAVFNGGTYTHSSALQYTNGSALVCACLSLPQQWVDDWILHPSRPAVCQQCLNSAGQNVYGALGTCGIHYTNVEGGVHIQDYINSVYITRL